MPEGDCAVRFRWMDQEMGRFVADEQGRVLVKNTTG
jgi:hypothetical protein